MKMMTQRAIWLGQAAGQGIGVKAMGDQELVAAIASAPKAVAIFYSPNCPYSRKFLPIYEALAPQYPDVLFASVNVDQHVQQAGLNKVQMLPTVVFFVNGKPVGRIDGVQEQSDFIAEMGKAFSGTPAAAAATPSPRSGTLVAIEPSAAAKVVPYVLGGAVVLGVLGAAGYLIFGK
jgi:thioredoxin-like negative regulator of GroEL